MTKNCHCLFALTVPIAAAIVGCGSSGTPTTGESAPPSHKAVVMPELQPVGPGEVQRTVVHLNPDGTQSIKSFVIPQSQSQAERAERVEMLKNPGMRELITDDSSCADSDIWAFTGTGCDSSTEYEICFYGEGTATMSDYTYCTAPLHYVCEGSYLVPWTDEVRSYWPGTEDGYWYGCYGEFCNDEDFSADQSCTNAGTYASGDISLTLSD